MYKLFTGYSNSSTIQDSIFDETGLEVISIVVVVLVADTKTALK
jgi:hypothetical protein